MNPSSVSSVNNRISISGFNARTYFSLLAGMHEVRRAGYRDAEVVVEDGSKFFPNGVLPCFVALQYWRDSGMDITVKVPREPCFARSGFTQSAADVTELGDSPTLGRIIGFETSKQVNDVVTTMIDELSKRVSFGEGVLISLEWALNEVMDNVLVHSGASRGYVMAQAHPTKGRVAVCVMDSGKGIFESLRTSRHAPRTAVDALTAAIRKGVTRDESVGQGNGLWGLSEIVRANGSSLRLVSGSGSISIQAESLKTNNEVIYLDCAAQATLIDFQIDAARAVAIKDVLGGHEPLNLRVEATEVRPGVNRLSVAELSGGTGTRQAARAFRIRIMNLWSEGVDVVLLDFTGVRVVASSYADELLGKLLLEIGFLAFNHKVRVEHANDTVAMIINRSILQRLATAHSEPPPDTRWTVTAGNDNDVT
jgi:anti-sigma regulatory factor (Ser/Thr protein kinase)